MTRYIFSTSHGYGRGKKICCGITSFGDRVAIIFLIYKKTIHIQITRGEPSGDIYQDSTGNTHFGVTSELI